MTKPGGRKTPHKTQTRPTVIRMPWRSTLRKTRDSDDPESRKTPNGQQVSLESMMAQWVLFNLTGEHKGA